MKSPTKWFGGKAYLAKRIVAMMPRCRSYVEPYFGSGGVLFERDPADSAEVVNDLSGNLTTFWKVLACPVQSPNLIRMLQATPFSESHWEEARDILSGDSGADDLAIAYNFFIFCRQSMAGRMDSFAPLTRTRLRRGMSEQASAWLSAVEGLPAAHERLRRVVILNRHAPDVIRQMDDEGTLAFCDPPYVQATRTAPDIYEHEMSVEAHEELLGVLGKLKGKMILSGYRCDLYDAAAGRYGWCRADIELPNASGGGKVKQMRVESLWTNFEVAS